MWLRLAKWSEFKSVYETKEKVDRWKEIISTTDDYYKDLPDTGIQREYEIEDDKEVCIETEYNPKEDFVERLAEKKPDTKRKVQNIINRIENEQLEWTQQEIADKVELSQNRVSEIIGNGHLAKTDKEIHNFLEQGKDLSWIVEHYSIDMQFFKWK